MNSGQACRPCRGSCSPTRGRGCFGDLPGDKIVVSPPSPIVEPLSCLRSFDVLGAALPPRLDFSIIETFVYSRAPSEHSSSPRFGPHVFRGSGIPTLLPQARLPRETISLCWGASPPVDSVGKLALSASTSSRINRCHEGTLVHERTLQLGR